MRKLDYERIPITIRLPLVLSKELEERCRGSIRNTFVTDAIEEKLQREKPKKRAKDDRRRPD